MRRKQQIRPALYLVENHKGETIDRGTHPTLDDLQDYAQKLLDGDKAIKRVAFYDSKLNFINALARPGYAKSKEERAWSAQSRNDNGRR